MPVDSTDEVESSDADNHFPACRYCAATVGKRRFCIVPDKSPERKSIDYAEQLGLNSVYEQACVSRDRLDEALTSLSELRDKKRELEARKQSREMDVSIDEHGKHHDLSQAALDRHLKAVYHKDAELIEIRNKLLEVTNDIEGLEYDVDLHNADIKITVARLHELGGYFQFMAVIKQAAEARKTSEAKRDVRNPW